MAIGKRKDNKNRVLKEGEYQRKNGTYEYKWRDKSGKRHSIYAETLDELRNKKSDVLRDILNGTQTQTTNLTINDMYNRWVQLKRGLKDNTFANYKYMYTQFVEPSFGNIKLKDIKRSDVRAFYNTLADERNLKTQTIDNIHTVLHQVLDTAVEDGYLQNNPSHNALKELKKAHNNDVTKRHALTLQQQKLFETFLSKQGQYHKWYPIFYVMLFTGLRVGEITGLRWCDVDFDNNTISVNHTLVYFSRGDKPNGTPFAINTPKSDAGTRIIPMLPKVREALLSERDYQKECRIECKAVINGYTDFIFVNRFGGTQHQGTLNKALRRITRDCNYEILDKQSGEDVVTLPPFSCHHLRHTFCTRLCEADVNVKVIQEVMGHADIRTTMDIYAEVTAEVKNKKMNGFVDYMDAVTTNIRQFYDQI